MSQFFASGGQSIGVSASASVFPMKEMATHSSTLAWKIPWTEEPGSLQSMGSKESDTAKGLHFPFSFPGTYSRDICSLQSQIEDKDIQCTVLSVKPSGLP